MDINKAKQKACGIIDAMKFYSSKSYDFSYDGLYFISGPMSGMPNWNKDAFDACQEKLCEIVDPNGVENPAENIPAEYEDEKPHTHYMLETLHAISDNLYRKGQKENVPLIDALVLLPDWETSYGAVMEAMVAHECGVDIVLWEDDDEND